MKKFVVGSVGLCATSMTTHYGKTTLFYYYNAQSD